MSNRNTETEKWNDPWFRRLSPETKLLFLYLCDRCDIAGFWEIDTEMAEFHIGYDQSTIKGALKGLGGKTEENEKYIWLCNFIRRQNNLPLNLDNNAHRGIIRRLEDHQGLCRGIDRLLVSVNASSPTGGAAQPPCKGNGKDKGNRGSKGSGKRGKYEAEFEAWWLGEDGEPSYPRHISKKYSMQKYVSARKNGATREQLAIGKRYFVQYVRQERIKKEFIPYASTWLNQERWTEFQEPPKSSSSHLPSDNARPASDYEKAVKRDSG